MVIFGLGKLDFRILSDLNSYLERSIQLSAIRHGQYYNVQTGFFNALRRLCSSFLNRIDDKWLVSMDMILLRLIHEKIN